MIDSTSGMDRPVEKRRRATWKWWAIIAIGLLAAVVLFPSVHRWATSETSIALNRIRVGETVRGDLVREVAVQGNVIAAFSPTLVSPARGTVRVSVRAGEVVEAGAALAQVESPEVQSLFQQERSALLSLQADLERQRAQSEQTRLRNEDRVALRTVELEAARRALGRQERLRDEGLTNAVLLEEAEDTVTIAKMQLAAAHEQSRLESATAGFEVHDRLSRVERQRLVTQDLERRVDELVLKAPVDGLVARVQVNDRDSVSANQPLVTIVDLSAFEIEVPVPEAYADDVQPGTPAEITYVSRRWPGTVKSIAPEVEGSRVPAIVVFDGEAPEGLKQNQRVSVRLVLDTRADVLKVPRGPFLEAGGGRTAYVIEDGVAVLRPIAVGALSVSEVEIVSGLEPGDQIIVSDTRRFKEAERVRIRD